MPLGMEVGLSPGQATLLNGDPAAPAWKGAEQSPPLFGLCLLWPNGHPSEQLLSSCMFISHTFKLHTMR